MVDRVDLLIAVIGIIVSILGSSTALWMALSKRADREDLIRLDAKLESRIDRLETKLETRFDSSLTRVETKLDGLILRLVPEQLPRPEN